MDLFNVSLFPSSCVDSSDIWLIEYKLITLPPPHQINVQIKHTAVTIYIRNNVDLKIKYVRKGQQFSNRLHTVSERGANKKRVAGDGLDCTIERCPVILLFLLLRGAVNNSRTGSLQRSRSGSSSGSIQ